MAHIAPRMNLTHPWYFGHYQKGWELGDTNVDVEICWYMKTIWGIVAFIGIKKIP